jgi:hypothetical protein
LEPDRIVWLQLQRDQAHQARFSCIFAGIRRPKHCAQGRPALFSAPFAPSRQK